MVAASAAVPAAAGAAGILVRLPGGERHLTPEEVGAAVDRPAGTYLLRAAGTSAEPVAHPPALSIRRLVALAGASPDALTFVTIERPNGSLAMLGRADLADPAPFPDGPPIVWMDAGGARYLRPLRDASDVNGADNIDITDGDLVVQVRQGPLLVVRASADRRVVRAGTAVHFTAEVVRGAGQGLAFAWRFGDGGSASGQAVAHAFSAAGVYEAVVTVNGTDDSGGASAPLRIRVGAAAAGGGDTGGGTGDRRRAPAQGPREGAGDGGSVPATTTRPPATTTAPATTPTAPATTAPSVPAPAPAPARPTATTAPRATLRRPAPRPRRAPAPRRTAAAPRRPSGRVVRGTLVAAQAPAALPGATPAAAAPAFAARRGEDRRRDPLAPAAGILAAIALVGLGVRRERRASGPRRSAA